jgi:PTH2 family peptidyl-tRNA hydrolase
MQEIKQVILVRADLKMRKGKTAAQVAHAAVDAFKRSKFKIDWERTGSKKVVLSVKDDKELRKFLRLATELDLPKAIIQDAGRTELPEGTVTCLAIGPAPEDRIDSITGELKTL